MERFLIEGNTPLIGEIKVSGAKNVAMKVLLAGILSDDVITIRNVPLISSVFGTADMMRSLGVRVAINDDHRVIIRGRELKKYTIPITLGGLYRTATMAMGPLLARFGKAIVPNPGGCRIGLRPIDRHIDGLRAMGAVIDYSERDGYFIGKANGLKGVKYRFPSNTHTGTETLILAAVLAKGRTILENAAAEPEVDDMIRLLNSMGAVIRRTEQRMIVIEGVRKLTGTDFTVMPDRNEAVTFAIAAFVTGGDIIIEGTERENLKSFLEKVDEAKGNWEPVSANKTRFFATKNLSRTEIITQPHPGFMTDWQAPWALLMCQSGGESVIHETIYEDRFGYVGELLKMGAKISFFNPHIATPQDFYNFNWSDRQKGTYHSIRIKGKTPLHNAILQVSDLRAGATLLMAALSAQGESILSGLEHIDRGYENIDQRLNKLGAKIRRIHE